MTRKPRAGTLRARAERMVEDELGFPRGTIDANRKRCRIRDWVTRTLAAFQDGWASALIEDAMIRIHLDGEG